MALFATAPASAGDVFSCADAQITVEAESQHMADAVCADAQAGREVMLICGIVVDQPLHIRLQEKLQPGCVGEYHCGQGIIDLLSPAAMADVRKPTSPLAHVSTKDYFRSILTHELAHAAYDTVPCPYGSCRATSEYLAHAFQVLSLSEGDRAKFEETLDMKTHVPRDSLNVFLYFMSPKKFLRLTWVHLNQREDTCTYLSGIMSGQTYMDHSRF